MLHQFVNIEESCFAFAPNIRNPGFCLEPNTDFLQTDFLMQMVGSSEGHDNGAQVELAILSDLSDAIMLFFLLQLTLPPFRHH